ncbi:MAG: alpha/beta hydrolase [Bacteroidota bacterium]|nr:alpha/beta hydrolase [Bacteroidota bacterium]
MDIKIKGENTDELHGLHMPVANARGCILMVHGLGEHIARYRGVAAFFNDYNYSFIGLDLPGHGKSPGKRGHIANFDQYNEIVSAMAKFCREREGDMPLILYGHSLGGGIALKYLLEKNNMDRGIITSPWIKLGFEPPKMKLILAYVVRHILPSLLQPTGLVPEDISSDKSIVDEYRSDPLIHSMISVNLFVAANANARRLLNCRDELKIPVLIMHSGEDRISSPDGSVILAENNRMAEMKIWKNGYHELHNEVFKDEVLKYIVNWLNKENGIKDKS